MKTVGPPYSGKLNVRWDGKGMARRHERAIEALQRGNPQTTDRLALPMVGHSFTLDVICHCRTEAQARGLWRSIEERFSACGLELHQQKTRIVYCKDSNRPGGYIHEQFDFLGYTFRPRRSMGRYGFLVSFSPAVSQEAIKSMYATVREWHIQRRSTATLERLAEWVNPVLRGWLNYYGRYHPSALYPFLRNFNRTLVTWTQKKHRRLSTSNRRAIRWLGRIAQRQPGLFVHWRLVSPPAG